MEKTAALCPTQPSVLADLLPAFCSFLLGQHTLVQLEKSLFSISSDLCLYKELITLSTRSNTCHTFKSET